MLKLTHSVLKLWVCEILPRVWRPKEVIGLTTEAREMLNSPPHSHFLVLVL